MATCLVIGTRKAARSRPVIESKGYTVTLTDMQRIPDKEELKALGIRVVDERGIRTSSSTMTHAFIVKNPV